MYLLCCTVFCLCCTVFCTFLAVRHPAARFCCVCRKRAPSCNWACPSARQALLARSLHILQANITRQVQQVAHNCYRTRLSTVKLMVASIGVCGPLAAYPCHRPVLQLAAWLLPTQPSSVQQPRISFEAPGLTQRTPADLTSNHLEKTRSLAAVSPEEDIIHQVCVPAERSLVQCTLRLPQADQQGNLQLRTHCMSMPSVTVSCISFCMANNNA